MIQRRLFLITAAALTAAFGATAVAARAADPAPKVDATPKAFATTNLSLYLPDDVMAQRGPPTSLLAPYVRALIAAADKAISALPPGRGASGAFVVALKPPGRSRVWIMIGDPARQAEFTALLKGPLEAVPAPGGVRDVNAFAISFNAWGGGAPLASASLPVPDEWRRALPKGGGVLPDDALRGAWPN